MMVQNKGICLNLQNNSTVETHKAEQIFRYNYKKTVAKPIQNNLN